VGDGPNGTGQPGWLRDYLQAQAGSSHAAVVKLEPFVAWLDGTAPASADPPALMELYAFWLKEMGPHRSRVALEAVCELYAFLGEQGVDGARQRWAIADDFLRNRIPAPGEPPPPVPKPKIGWRGGIADVLASVGMMSIGVLLVVWGWLSSSPTTIIAGMGYGPVMPLVAGMALGAFFLLFGYVAALLAVRRLGPVPPRTNLIVMVGLALVSLAFCVTGMSGAFEVLGEGSLAYALPFLAFAVAGTFGMVTIAIAVFEREK